MALEGLLDSLSLLVSDWFYYLILFKAIWRFDGKPLWTSLIAGVIFLELEPRTDGRSLLVSLIICSPDMFFFMY